MAALDFPASPALNERYPTAPIPGVATYTWDGQKWIIINGDAGGGGDVITGPITGDAGDVVFTPAGDVGAGNVQDAIVELDAEKIGEAPVDGKQYARQDAAWSEVIGGGGGSGDFLPLTGGTLTGELTIAAPAFNSNLVLNAPDSTHSNFIYGKRAGLELWRIVPGASTTGDFTVMQFDDAGNWVVGQQPLTIAHTTGLITVKADPTAALGVATKQYVDANAGSGGGGAYLPLTGGTVTGDLTVQGASTFIDVLTAEGYIQCNGDLYSTGSIQITYDFIAGGENNNFPKAFGDGAAPTADNQYANKKYVDDTVAAGGGGGGGLTQAQADTLYVKLAGGDSIQGDLYLENNGMLSVEGGIFAGGDVSTSGNGSFTSVFVNGAPTQPLEVANKGYVDARVAKAGDTMTGQLTLPGTASANLHAIHKGYVDANFAGVAYVNSQDALKVSKGGDTMTGPLVMPNSGTQAANSITFGTAGTGFNGASSQLNFCTSGTQRLNLTTTDLVSTVRFSAPVGSAASTSYNFGSSNTGLYGAAASISAAILGSNKLTIDGSTVTTTLPIVLPADPSANLQAATKQYVDAAGVNALKSNATATISVGYTITPANLGNITSFTLNPALGNYQYGTNTAAFTLTAPTADCAVDILITNSATAGAITFTGFTVGANTGDALTVVNANKFIISIRRIATISTYTIKALQ